MRAQVLHSPASITSGPLRSEDSPAPTPGPADLLLEVFACGVCRTDLQLVEGDLAPRKLPVVPGHQVVGRVTAVGDDVRDWRIGDRAGVAWFAGACGECRHCLNGRENLCEAAEFTGWDRDGGYAEQIVVRADYAFRLPPDFSDLAAAPLLCGGVIGYRSLLISGVQPGERLGLYGFGASASLAIQVATYWGCEVFVVTRSPRDQERARALGAAWAGPGDQPPPAPLAAAISFAPSGEVVVSALKAIDRGGIVAINAIHLDRIPEFPYDDLWWERQIRSVANFTRRDAREFLDLAAKIPIRTSTEEFPLKDANLALQRLKDGRVSGAAVLLP